MLQRSRKELGATWESAGDCCPLERRRQGPGPANLAGILGSLHTLACGSERLVWREVLKKAVALERRIVKYMNFKTKQKNEDFKRIRYSNSKSTFERMRTLSKNWGKEELRALPASVGTLR